MSLARYPYTNARHWPVILSLLFMVFYPSLLSLHKRKSLACYAYPGILSLLSLSVIPGLLTLACYPEPVILTQTFPIGLFIRGHLSYSVSQRQCIGIAPL